MTAAEVLGRQGDIHPNTPESPFLGVILSLSSALSHLLPPHTHFLPFPYRWSTRHS